jgi:hypothetical protein
MVLLSQMMRTAAFTGSTDSLFTRIVGRQGGRWAEQTVGAAFPSAGVERPTEPPTASRRAPANRAIRLGELTDLRARGFLTDGELERLRARLEP